MKLTPAAAAAAQAALDREAERMLKAGWRVVTTFVDGRAVGPKLVPPCD